MESERIEESEFPADPFASLMQSRGLLPLPIVVVDDQNAGDYADFLRDVYDDRLVVAYTDLESARRGLLNTSRPFALILDHNMNGDSPVEEGDEVGADLAALLRLRHPWGLVLPIAYYSRVVKTEENWVDINRQHGWLGATMFYRKGDTRGDFNAEANVFEGEIVPALDSYFMSIGPGYLGAMQMLQRTGYDFLSWTFEGDSGNDDH